MSGERAVPRARVGERPDSDASWSRLSSLRRHLQRRSAVFGRGTQGCFENARVGKSDEGMVHGGKRNRWKWVTSSTRRTSLQ